MEIIALEAVGIVKNFGATQALKGVDLKVFKNEVHAVVGENGAGKSTLIKALAGDHAIDEGVIYLDSQKISGLSTHDIQDKGLHVVHQHLNVVPSMTVGENILLGSPPTNKAKILAWKKSRKKAEDTLRLISDTISLDEKVENLSAAEKQLVIIARAIVNDPKILILDEPTARLGMKESEQLFKLIQKLKDNGVTIIYISHRLEEIYRVCDRVSIFRDGQKITTMNLSEISEDEMVANMIGRSISNYIPKSKVEIGEKVLEVKGLNFERKVRNISFEVRKGEIVGLVGSVGAGKSEVLDILFGTLSADSGEAILSGQVLMGNNEKTIPHKSIKAGIAYIPEDRQIQGLVLQYSNRENFTLVDIDKVSKYAVIRSKLEQKTTEELINKLLVKPKDSEYITGALSGGNQQKIAIGKWMLKKYSLYLMDEVTAGVDVGAKSEIYKIIGEFVKDGSSVLLATSDITEALGICDRLIVLHRGEIIKELDVREATRENLLLYMMGGVK